MKTLKILFVTFALALTASAHAQDYVSTPVTLSTEKVRMSGKLYYSHVVLERQTLFSIAKAYGVSIEDIYAAVFEKTRTVQKAVNACRLSRMLSRRKKHDQRDRHQ